MIRLTLLDNTKKEVELFDEITENNNILKIDCSFPEINCWAPTDIYSNVRLTSLPNMYFPNLQYFDCNNFCNWSILFVEPLFFNYNT